MATFFALVPDLTARRRLREAVEKAPAHSRVGSEVRFVDSWAEMHGLALKVPPWVTVFDPYATGSLDTQSCGSFRMRFPTTVLFAYGRFDRRSARDVLDLARLGVLGVATQGCDDTPARLRNLLREASSRSAADTILTRLANHLTPEFAPLVRYLFWSYRAVTPAAAARFCNRHPKTLRERLREAGLPPTHKLIVWMRLLHAAWLLQDTARSVENVALALDFPSANAFRNQLRRYAGVRPSDLVTSDGFDLLLQKFADACGG